MAPAATRKLRRGRGRTGALRRPAICPGADLVDLVLGEALVVLELAVMRIGKPRRHLSRGDLGLDRPGPRPRLLIGEERHRRNLVGAVTLCATAEENRC